MVKRVLLGLGAWAAAFAGATALPAAAAPGLTLVSVPAGEFRMGNTEICYNAGLCHYELPAHTVRISAPFRISSTEVTLELYRQFDAGFTNSVSESGAALVTGVSWHSATNFCAWLSRREGLPFRLATEAEWEYAARNAAGLGLRNMQSGPREWCLDWFGEYPEQAQTDPSGPDAGFARVVRGGCLDEPNAFWSDFLHFAPVNYAHASHRAGMAPSFGTFAGAPVDFGRHHIGFRVVQAALPATQPRAADAGFVRQGVKPTAGLALQSPDPDKPYLRKRRLLPVPPAPGRADAIAAAGLHPSFRGHNHSPGLTVCPNGDVLAVYYTSVYEYEPEVSLIASRLRLGAEEWDMPVPFVDFPGANDHAPLLYTEGDTVRLFWGGGEIPGAFPFQWTESRDSGATWCEVRFPRFPVAPGAHSRQPVNSAFRGTNGTLYVASDAGGSTSLLWASDDGGETWRDTGGRSAGRHTAFCRLGDGRLLGMGGKNSDIDGCMPGVVSGDGGRTWTRFKTVFPALGSNQRPTVRRLQSGRLFFAGDFQDFEGDQPPGVTNRGCYVALSGDDGATWLVKKLQGTQRHENPANMGGADTLGYAASCQAPNGMIHLITSMNVPCLHFELNEAWILSPAAPDPGEEALTGSSATRVGTVAHYQDAYSNGVMRVGWSGGTADDGRYLLHGQETRYYPGGRKQYETTYQLGRKTGAETQWRADGTVEWTWQYNADTTNVWTQFWADGSTRKSESRWVGKVADGLATCWTAGTQETWRARFTAGEAAIERFGRRGVSVFLANSATNGARCYHDRSYTLASLPAELEGGDLVQTANADDAETRSDYLAFDVAAPSTVYVCYKAGRAGIPGWLGAAGWEKLPAQAHVNAAGTDVAFDVYSRSVPAGALYLGGNERGVTGANCMYFVVFRAVDGLPASSLRIMPMGDSITWGGSGGGYRRPLYNLLVGAGYDFDFVGRKCAAHDITPDTNHWGAAGWQMSFTGVPGGDVINGRSYVSLEGAPRPGIYNELGDAISRTYFSASPGVRNVILLMIGMNDFLHQVVDSAYGVQGGDVGADAAGEAQDKIAEGCIDRLQGLLTKIDTLAGRQGLSLDVIVATINRMSLRWKGDPVSEVMTNEVAQYNQWIRSSLPSASYAHLKVEVVELEDPLVGKLADGVHPNAEGFNTMAQVWYAALTNRAAPGTPQASTAPVSTTRPPRLSP